MHIAATILWVKCILGKDWKKVSDFDVHPDAITQVYLFLRYLNKKNVQFNCVNYNSTLN